MSSKRLCRVAAIIASRMSIASDISTALPSYCFLIRLSYTHSLPLRRVLPLRGVHIATRHPPRRESWGDISPSPVGVWSEASDANTAEVQDVAFFD